MASISANGSNGHHKFTLTVTENSTSTANNTSAVSFSFVISPVQASWNWELWGANITYTVTVNGSQYTGSIANYDGYSSVTLKSGSLTVGHNSDGSKSISFSFSVTDTSGQSYTCGNASGSGSMALTNIPRYLSITSYDITNITETSIVVRWTTSDPRSGTYYSFDNGTTWIGSSTYGESLGSDNKSGTFNILDLTPNTAYKLKIRIKRTDSGLWTESSEKSFNTYDYPKPTSLNNFNIGDGASVGVYNPLGRVYTLDIISNVNGAVIGSYTGSYSESAINAEFKTEDAISKQYASIPNSASGTYYARVTYGSSVKTLGTGTYSIRGNEIPTIGNFSYIDNNSTTVTLTGNNQHIVQNYSSLVAQVGNATANNGAGGISKYVVECNGKSVQSTSSGNYSLGEVNSNRDVDLKLTVTDTRGLTASKTITVTMLAHSTPNASVTLERLNNYEDETYLTVDGSVSSLNSKNTMAIKYRYKVSGGSYGSYATIADRQKYTLSLSKNNAYIFEIVVTDALGSTFTKEYVLNKGVFPLFIDTRKNSVGINCFPTKENSLEVNGKDMTDLPDFVDKYEKSHKQILLNYEGGLIISVDSVYGSDKIPIVVTGINNASYVPVHTIIQYRTDGTFGYINLGSEIAVTIEGNHIHLDALRWSYFEVSVPMGSEITLLNGAV
jgi:hypothetical protein